jgi:uncharacterized protein YqgC (DUF456 family)
LVVVFIVVVAVVVVAFVVVVVGYLPKTLAIWSKMATTRYPSWGSALRGSSWIAFSLLQSASFSGHTTIADATATQQPANSGIALSHNH